MYVRIIPRLDIKGPNLVKGIHLEGLRVLGTPDQFARHYYEQGADELLYMDVVASLYGRNSLHTIVERTAREIRIPLTVGGGLRTLDDIRDVLRVGADKVSINTAGVKRPEFIQEAARRFGCSTIVVSIEAIRRREGGYEVYTDNGREHTGLDAFDWALKCAELGAGELLVTSIDQEGTARGFDLELTQRIARSVSIPVIACGGAGRLRDISDVIQVGRADAVAVASILHYTAVGQLSSAAIRTGEGNLEYLKSGRSFSGGAAVAMESATIPDVKRYLHDNGVKCRAPEASAAI